MINCGQLLAQHLTYFLSRNQLVDSVNRKEGAWILEPVRIGMPKDEARALRNNLISAAEISPDGAPVIQNCLAT
ncbi:hypothetical protein PSCICN_49740 [Pseudomonas cichorii]|nr:hypothetical protein PSCICN_49740 [Pseudomonas cichorii]